MKMKWWNSVEQLVQDLRFGSRILWKSPGLSATAVILIALVIGGNTTIYSMVHALITRPAPGVRAERLVTLGTVGDRSEPFQTIPDYFDFAAQTKTLDPLIARGPERFALTIEDGSYAFFGAYVTLNFFDGLGVNLVRGRPFTEAENRLEGSGLVTIISHRVWQEHFQGSENIVGRLITLNGHAATVVGVAPPAFLGATLAIPEDFWVPIVGYFRTQGRERQLTDRSVSFAQAGVVVHGQLKPGVSISEAQAEFTTLAARLESAYPATNKGKSVEVHPYVGTIFGGLWVMGTRFLAIFSVVTSITLFIVCANVANLLLARAVTRMRESAVRQSLGASRMRIVRMLVAEGFSISLAAWAAACAVAYWISLFVPKLFGDTANNAGMRGNQLNVDFTPDWQVLAYAMLLAILGTLAFSIAPALTAWRQQVLPALKSGEPGVARGRSRLSNVLVVAQLAFSVLLLTLSGLSYRSVSMIRSLDRGFDQNNVLLVTVNPTLSIANRQVNLALLESLQNRFSLVPGVSAVSYVRVAPPHMWSREQVRIAASGQPLFAQINFVGPHYLEVLGLKPLAGREFMAGDRVAATRGALINQNLADALWPGESPVGHALLIGEPPAAVEVIGVAPNAWYAGHEANPRPNFVFLAEHQDPVPPTAQAGLLGSGETTFHIKYSGSLDNIVPAARTAIREADERIPIVSMRTMNAQFESSDGALATMLLTFFSGISLVIATTGQYAVIAFDMRRRTREFGVRVAMGASPRQILASVLRQGLLLTAAGLVVGFLLSAAVGTAMGSIWFGVTPTDAVTYFAVFSVLAVASLLASYLPARRASRTDPLVALRME
jgi:predicted permease